MQKIIFCLLILNIFSVQCIVNVPKNLIQRSVFLTTLIFWVNKNMAFHLLMFYLREPFETINNYMMSLRKFKIDNEEKQISNCYMYLIWFRVTI